MNDYAFNRASSPQLNMSMHGLNNLINNNVQLQRLDNINNNVQLQRLGNIIISQIFTV